MIEPLWWLLFLLGLLATIANVLSLLQGFRLGSRVRHGLRFSFGAYLPKVAVLLPVRGLDEGFDENIAAILGQEYFSCRVVAVADEPHDQVLGRLREVAGATPGAPLEVVVADSGAIPGKVNALRTALHRLTPEDEVVVFADADIRPGPDWLRQLVQPLADVTVGVSTGFRWYVPPRPSFWSLVRSEWNAVSANVLFDPARNYAWGGSCAVRADVLSRLNLDERWREVLSDDLVLTRAIREAGLGIVFAPAALVPTFEGADRATCLEWCFRQIAMASLYLRVVRRYALGAFAVFDGAILLGLLSLILASLVSTAFVGPSALLLATLPTTVAKATLRRRAFFHASPAVRDYWHIRGWQTALAALAVPWLMAVGLMRTRHLRTVRWRGRTYDVEDPFHVRLRQLDPETAERPG